MDWTLHNYGYKNINFRKVVLEELKRYNIAIHLRDEYIDRLGLDDVEKWLESENYYIEQIEWAKKRLTEATDNYNAVLIDESIIKDAYEKECAKISSMKTWENTFYADEVTKIIECLHDFEPKVNNWIDKAPANLDFITKGLKDMLETAKADMTKNAQENVKSLDRIKDTTFPEWDTFRKDYIEKAKSNLDWAKEEVKNKKKALKNVQERNHTIKQVFEILDQLEVNDGQE